MATDTLLALSVVACAGAFLLRRALRSLRAARRPKAGCGGDCGCH
jgi:hypothetical protein